jgi:hypothetical protein
LGGDLDGFGVEKEAHVVQEVARFAEDAAATLGDVRIPVGRIEFASHDAVGNGERSGRAGEQLLKLAAGRGESPVESHLDGTTALCVSVINLAQLFAVQANRFFDEDLTLRIKRAEDKRGMQVVARADDDRSVTALLEGFLGVRFGTLETEFRFDVIGAEGGLVDHGAERNLVL